MTTPKFKLAYLIGLGIMLIGLAIDQLIIAGIGGLVVLLWVLYTAYEAYRQKKIAE